ncbi:hypothetical protein PIB30_096131 [Stylosanthes scabra]|uniref:FAR1 domain-containing protein n=1 Tax=Stylosanthes scabra TaxID=79078 RepID=A0ABU6TWJ6_9FABA|nr:hypothetical protein [Stylosanthes scabra]
MISIATPYNKVNSTMMTRNISSAVDSVLVKWQSDAVVEGDKRIVEQMSDKGFAMGGGSHARVSCLWVKTRISLCRRLGDGRSIEWTTEPVKATAEAIGFTINWKVSVHQRNDLFVDAKNCGNYPEIVYMEEGGEKVNAGSTDETGEFGELSDKTVEEPCGLKDELVEDETTDYRDVIGLTADAILRKVFRNDNGVYEFYKRFGKCHGFGVRKGDCGWDDEGRFIRRKFLCNWAGLREQ